MSTRAKAVQVLRVERRRGTAFRKAADASTCTPVERRVLGRDYMRDVALGRLRDKLVRAIVKATVPGRQTQRQVADLERRAHKAFGDVCRRAAK